MRRAVRTSFDAVPQSVVVSSAAGIEGGFRYSFGPASGLGPGVSLRAAPNRRIRSGWRGWWRPVVLRLRAEHAVLGMRDRRVGPVGSLVAPVGKPILSVPLAAGMEVWTQQSHPPAAAFEPKLVAVHAVEQRVVKRGKLTPYRG